VGGSPARKFDIRPIYRKWGVLMFSLGIESVRKCPKSMRYTRLEPSFISSATSSARIECRVSLHLGMEMMKRSQSRCCSKSRRNSPPHLRTCLRTVASMAAAALLRQMVEGRQFSDGRSTWSTTRTSTGPLSGFSSSPSCSLIAVKIDSPAVE